MIDLREVHPSGGHVEVFYNEQYSTSLFGEEIGEFIRTYHAWGFPITLHRFMGLTQR
jgi:hypothetical protein